VSINLIAAVVVDGEVTAAAEAVDTAASVDGPADAIGTGDLSLEAVCLLSSAVAAEELYNSRLRDNMAALFCLGFFLFSSFLFFYWNLYRARKKNTLICS